MVKGVTAFDWDLYKRPELVLKRFRETQEWSDAVLVSSDGTHYPVHKAIVSALSKTFWDFLTEQLAKPETETTEVTTSSNRKLTVKKLHVPVNDHIMMSFLDCAYEGGIKTDPAHVWEVLEAAEEYDIKWIETAVCSYLCKLVNKENCLEMYNLANRKQHTRLFGETMVVIKRNFQYVMNSSTFTSLDFDTFERILKSDELNVASEATVWEAIKKWISNQTQTRQLHVRRLLKSLRFLRTQSGFLDSILTDSVTVAIDTDNKIGSLVNTMKDTFAKTLGNFPIDGRGYSIGLQPTYVRPRTPSSVVLGIGGWKNGRTSGHIECYDIHTNQWYEHPCTRNCPNKAYHGLQFLNGKIFIIGGTNGNQVKDTVHSWDPVANSWRQEPHLSLRRCYVSTAVLDGKLYAIGGHNGTFRMRSCEVYDPNTKLWTEIPDMNVNRSDAAATAVDGKIYVMGGLNENQIERTAEVYDPINDTWTSLPEMVSQRTSLAAVSLDGLIYAIGGNSGQQRQSSVERFDPKTNTWTQMADMNQGRSTFSATTIDGKIFVAGGYDGFTPIAKVESFDPAIGIWEDVSDMLFPRSGLALITLSNLPDLKNFSYLGITQKTSRINNINNRASPVIEELDF